MSGDTVYSPPELPLHLKHVCDLKPIVGTPSDEELVGIHAVVQVANRVVDIHGVGDSTLLYRLSEHLFNAQMARYRRKYQGMIFPEDMTYSPPTLPVHVPVHLESVTGAPSEEEVIKVQDAIRSYQQFSNVPSIFDPRVNMELSQHLFDIQMAKYMQRAKQTIPSVLHQAPRSTVVKQTVDLAEEAHMSTNNAGTGTDVAESVRPGEAIQDSGIRDALEKSNRLAEQANQLAERANLLIERSNELMERSSQPVDQSNAFGERFSALFGRLSEHFERSDNLVERLIKPVENFGDMLKNTNRVLARIQHAIIRNHKGNTISALDCLANEKGETPGMSSLIGSFTFEYMLKRSKSYPTLYPPFSVLIDDVSQNPRISDGMLGSFLRFYGIGDDLCEEAPSAVLKTGNDEVARERLGKYISSCLG